MTHKQRKALALHKAIVRKRNIRTNNLKFNLAPYIPGRSRSYHLYDL